MANRKGGFRRGTRQIFQKDIREKGKISLRSFFQSFNAGDKVQLLAESAYQKGMYYPRYHGCVGVVQSKKGECYNVEVFDHDKPKTFIVHPVHLKRIK